jgi:hypothetical protein
MIHPLLSFKNELKEKALLIRRMKLSLKPKNRIKDPTLEQYVDEIWKLASIRYSYRHQHIAYCEVRGRTREQIEKPKETNLPKEQLVQSYKDELLLGIQKYNETLCNRT